MIPEVGAPDNGAQPRPGWWFALPVLAAIAAWWPLAPYWQSDDFLALHYARDLSNVLHDFLGPQYGAEDVWLFYRPLITLSFWVDQLIADADPFWSHLGNVLAHSVSALLVALIWRRFLPNGAAVCAGLLWALMPGHLGSLAWAVGRVDSHTTVWCLLATWLFVRRLDRRASGEWAAWWPPLAATTLALMSKESAFVLPPVLTVLAFARADAPFGRRLWLATRRSAPVWLLFGGYLVFRFVALGRFGGYLGARLEPLAMFEGLGLYVTNELVPLRWCGAGIVSDGAAAPLWSLGLAAAPLALPLVYWLRRPRGLLTAALLFVIACTPLAAFLAGASNVHNLRYLYLPSVVLAGLLAASGRLVTVLLLLAWCLPFVEARQQQRAADRGSATMHAAIQREADAGAPSPMFVAGLPHANRSGTAVQLHFAVDRMLAPPFGKDETKLYALRPLAPGRGVFRLSPEGDPPWALPIGSTWFFEDETAFGRAPVAKPLPELVIEGDEDGVVDFASARLLEFAGRWKELSENRAPTFGLRTPGVRPQLFRVTIFTANGYLACVCPDHGLAPQGTGSIDMMRFLVRDERLPMQPALYALAEDALASAAMVVPATIDRVPEFPVLIEAGRREGLTFVPTHRSRRMLTFHFDRGYARWVRILQGRE